MVAAAAVAAQVELELEVVARPLRVRRISSAPSAQGLKPRRVSAVRRFPPGCGRSPSPPPPPPASSPDSPIAVVEGTDGDLQHKDKESSEENTKTKRWMHSAFYPPPKRRPVSAVRRYPPHCGRDPHFTFGSIPPQIQIHHAQFQEQGEGESSAHRPHSQNDDDVHSRTDDKASKPTDTHHAHPHPHPHPQVPVDEKHSAIDEPTPQLQDDAIQVIQEPPLAVQHHPTQQLQVHLHSAIDQPTPQLQDDATQLTQEPPLAVQLQHHHTQQLQVHLHSAIDQPTPQLQDDAIQLIQEPPLAVQHIPTQQLQVQLQPDNASQDTTSTNGDAPDADTYRPSNALVLFQQHPSMQPTHPTGSSKGEKKVILKKKAVAKRTSPTKLGPNSNSDEPIISHNVPSQSCPDKDAAMDPHHHEVTTPIQKNFRVCAKKSVAGRSQPRLSLPQGNRKKKGSRVAKKSKRPLLEDSPAAHLPNSTTLNLPPVTPDSDGQSSARTKVKKILRLFQTVYRVLIQKEESASGKQLLNDKDGSQSKPKGRNRNDLTASDIVKRSGEYVERSDPVFGHVPGVEVGDEFRYRVELHLVGLHRHLQCGIDYTKISGVPLATSIVSSGGYSDSMDGSDVLIYSGSGGQPTGKKGQKTLPQDQKLEKGNLALKNSMDKKMPVRVIRGINSSESAKLVMTFIYDGLYMVDEFWEEPEHYNIDGKVYTANVFKYKLVRMLGQPEVGLNIATKSKKSEAREGLCLADLSQGKEKIPICAINTIDDEKPPKFTYITSMIYPPWYEKTIPKGCDCTGKCSSKRCACALKNGGEMPFNFNGAIVQAKQLIYECGPSCRCHRSCHNRVSQSGIKIALEIFKTENRGWGVRSLSSIPSGSFVCEYVGELLRDEEAERRDNDEYLFDIGHNYDDADLWKGLPSFVPGMGSMVEASSTDGASALEGFTIDAAEMGNVGRFINHSCSPNLYAQNVLFDHDDKRMPHIMFFAAENIPPLQELTYHYNYSKGEVRDSQGHEKVKECFCGSSECEGRLY